TMESTTNSANGGLGDFIYVTVQNERGRHRGTPSHPVRWDTAIQPVHDATKRQTTMVTASDATDAKCLGTRITKMTRVSSSMTTANLNRLHLLMIGMPMTEQIIQLLDQIDVLAQQSTQGPWEVSGRTIESDHVDSPYYLDVVSTEVNCMEFCHGGSGYGVDKTSDAEFIALSRTAMPMLAAAVRAAIELCDELDSTARDLTM